MSEPTNLAESDDVRDWRHHVLSNLLIDRGEDDLDEGSADDWNLAATQLHMALGELGDLRAEVKQLRAERAGGIQFHVGEVVISRQVDGPGWSLWLPLASPHWHHLRGVESYADRDAALARAREIQAAIEGGGPRG